ncbi:MAG TPA: zf-HC2 domain-containing protein [Terriglobia bacterium]
MTHLEIENLASDYLEGQLNVLRQAEVERHLAACPDCRDLMAGVRRLFELCQAAEPLEPPPWLVPKILRATVGERKPGLGERLIAWFRPVLQIRVVYGVAMAVFSLSMIANVAGINLRHVKAEDLNPKNWIYQANRNGHLMLGRAEKYYYDLKVVYEIESRLRQLRAQPTDEAPRRQAPAGGSTEGAPVSGPSLASNWTPGNAFQVNEAAWNLRAFSARDGGGHRSVRSTIP